MQKYLIFFTVRHCPDAWVYTYTLERSFGPNELIDYLAEYSYGTTLMGNYIESIEIKKVD